MAVMAVQDEPEPALGISGPPTVAASTGQEVADPDPPPGPGQREPTTDRSRRQSLKLALCAAFPSRNIVL